MVKKESVILNHFVVSILIFQYKSKSINLAKRFGVSGDDPDDNDDDANVNVAVDDHRKIWRIISSKSTNLGGMR